MVVYCHLVCDQTASSALAGSVVGSAVDMHRLEGLV